jgi:uncharacterized phiE125 gp8 family phage protein
MKALLAPGLSRTTGPTTEPLTLAEAKLHCRIPESEKGHDEILVELVRSAREQVENDTQQALLTQTFTLGIENFPGDGRIPVPMKPLQSVTSITYYDSGNSQQTLSSSVYGVNTAERLIYREYNQSWPSYTGKPGGIVVTFVAGYGDSAAEVPSILKHAMKLQISKWFEHAGDELNVHGASTYDQAYTRLIRRFLRGSYP